MVDEKLQGLSKLPAWLISLSLFLVAIGFLVSLYALEETKYFAGLEFGPKNMPSPKPSPVSIIVNGSELPSSGGNSKSGLCPDNSYMIGVRVQSDSGGPHGIISSVFPVCRTLEVSAN